MTTLASDHLYPFSRHISSLASIVEPNLPSHSGVIFLRGRRDTTKRLTRRRRDPRSRIPRSAPGFKRQHASSSSKSSPSFRISKAPGIPGRHSPRRKLQFKSIMCGSERESENISNMAAALRTTDAGLPSSLRPVPGRAKTTAAALHHPTDGYPETPTRAPRSVSLGQLHYGTRDAPPCPLFSAWTTTAKDDFSVYQKEKKESHIEMSLIQKINEGPGPLQQDQPKGQVYRMARVQSPGYVKIGITRVDLFRRRDQLSPNGRFGSLEPEVGPEGDWLFAYYKFAEKLVHLELWNERRESRYEDAEDDEKALLQMDGKSGSPEKKKEDGRTEWFEIDLVTAHAICAKWRIWFRDHEPYDSDGKLKRFWRDRFAWFHEYDPYSKDMHKSLHLRWTKILQPYRLQKWIHNVEVVCSTFWNVILMLYEFGVWVKYNSWAIFFPILSCLLWYFSVINTVHFCSLMASFGGGIILINRVGSEKEKDTNEWKKEDGSPKRSRKSPKKL